MYTEEDKLVYLLRDSRFKDLYERFSLEIDFTRQPEPMYKYAGGYHHIEKKK